MTTNPHTGAGRRIIGRPNTDAMWNDVPTISDPSTLADPTLWPSDDELDDFLTFVRMERHSDLAK